MHYIRTIPLLLILLLAGSFSPAAAQIGTCEEPTSEAILDTGNVRARIFNAGQLFWNGGRNLYEIPKEEGINAIFASTFNVGGLIDGRLHMATSTYGPYEFWPGPLDEQGNPPSDCSDYDQIWEIRTEDFELFDTRGIISFNMQNWPWELGAPVIDGDGDPDNYNLEGGDRPELLGDQTLWWIMNDRGNEHLWSETPPIGLEVRASAYAFNSGGIGSDITFYRYVLTNKNTSDLTDAFIAMWVDPDLGNASDDYIGSDSLAHLGFVYNGDDIDENGYEEAPPAAGYTFLATPEAQPDGIDNDHDGVIDEPGEPAGMYSAIYYQGGGGIVGDPSIGTEMYTYMRGLWVDGEPLTEGGDGRTWSDRPTRFVFSGDPSTRSYWSEVQPSDTGELSPNPASDRRFQISSGPFTLDTGETTEVLVALVWARGDNNLDSAGRLKGIAATMQTSPDSFLGSGYNPGQLTQGPLPAPEEVLGFDQNFPNPFAFFTTFRYSLPKTMSVRLAIYDVLGREVAVVTEGTQDAGVYRERFDGNQLSPGIYYARIELDHLSFTKKLVRIP